MTQAALETNFWDYRFLFEVSEDGMLLATEDGTIVEANPGACHILRRKRKDLEATTRLDEIFDPSDPRLGVALEERRRTGRFQGKLLMLGQDGKPFPAEVSIIDYRNGGGQDRIGIVFRDLTERERLEQALRETKWLDAVVRSAADPIVVVDADGTIRYVNPAIERVLGYRPEEFAKIGTEIVHPEDLRTAVEAVTQIADNPGNSVRLLVRLQHKNGSWCYLEGTGKNLLDDPNVKGLVFIARSVTEHKMLEEKIRQRNEELEHQVEEYAAQLEAAVAELRNKERVLDEVEERYHLLVEEGSDGVWDWDAGTGDLYWNDRIFEMLGLSRSGFTPTFENFVELLHPEDRQRLMYSICMYMRRDTPEHGATFTRELRVLHSAGEYRYCSSRERVLRDKNGALLRIVGTLTDLTQRKRAEEELRESEERFRVTFDLATVGMALLETDGRWITVNQELCKIVGYSREELLEKTLEEVFCPDGLDADFEQFRLLLAGDTESFSTERIYARKDRSQVWISLTASLARGSSGGDEYCILVVEDITARKQAESACGALTAREIDVLSLLARGSTNKEIAEHMNFSVGTAKINVQRIISKLGVSSRTQAALRAVEIGLVPPNGSGPQPPATNG